MILMLILVGLVLGGIFGFEAFRTKMIKQFMATLSAPVQTVSSMKAGYQVWQTQLEGVGTLRAVNGADLSAQVSGIISAIHFESGAEVKESTPLLELTAEDDLAKLRSLKAAAALARITYDRDQRQLKVQAVSQQTVDADEQNLKSAEAQVAQQQATIDYKTVKAPFAGKLGIRQVDLGQYLAAGTTIVTLQSLDPIFVDFFLPQQALAEIANGQPVVAHIDAYPGQVFAGQITAINPKIDVASRNIQIRATLKNADHRLLPGMFTTIDIDTGKPQRYITLPQTAITFNPYGNTVYVVDDTGKGPNGQPQLAAHQTFVTTGATRGDQIAVLTGVKEGDEIVTAGQIKLHNGTPVRIDNAVQPSNDANPHPAEE
jgi:membrane fusion protein (multidrug efflux system)